MNSLRILLLGVLSAVAVQAAEPLKALLITGGCCHDYAKQKLIISQGVSKRANVDWTNRYGKVRVFGAVTIPWRAKPIWGDSPAASSGPVVNSTKTDSPPSVTARQNSEYH